MCEFEKGQIVYVSDDKDWVVSHFIDFMPYNEHKYKACAAYPQKNGYMWNYKYCLSVEDYHKMLKQPKDNDLVWAWDSDFVSKHLKVCGFYSKEEDRIMNSFKYEKYEVIPREQWPQWAIEAYELLED